MKNLIRDIGIVSIGYSDVTMEFEITYFFNLGDGKTMENVITVPRYKENIAIGELLEEFKTHAYSKVTLKEIAPFYVPKNSYYESNNTIKPPLGIFPRKLRDEARIQEIKEGIDRNKVANRPISIAWVEEFNELVIRNTYNKN